MTLEEIFAMQEVLYKKKKLTKEETEWLYAQPLFHRVYGFPYMYYDTIAFPPNEIHHLKITLLDCTHPKKMFPFLKTSDKKGWLHVDYLLEPFPSVIRPPDKKTKLVKKTKNLQVCIDTDKREDRVRFVSETGILSVGYYCISQFYDISCCGFTKDSMAMRREEVAPNKYIYHCKHTRNNDFSALRFSLEWTTSDDTSSAEQ